jgi:DNA-binding NarL/FixJ family response regulator
MRILEIGTSRIGYRLKDKIASISAPSDTLERIAEGEIVIEPVLAARLISHRQGQEGQLAALSEREVEVLGLMAEGRSNNGIATRLYLSTKAIEKHVASIFAKLSLPADATVHHNRRVLAVLAYLRTQRPKP